MILIVIFVIDCEMENTVNAAILFDVAKPFLKMGG